MAQNHKHISITCKYADCFLLYGMRINHQCEAFGVIVLHVNQAIGYILLENQNHLLSGHTDSARIWT